MFRKKKPTTIQEILKESWLNDEIGIVANLPYEDVIGTSGQGGNLRVGYATLKKIFGKPSVDNKNGRGSKIRKEWIISIDGVVCTIYDWKQGKQYRGYRPLKDAEWSVGGSHPISRRLVQGVIDAYMIEKGLI